MLKIFTFLFLFQLHSIVIAQSYEPILESDMPTSISNNAVVGGIYQDTFCVFSFAGIDSTKSFSGIHLKSFRYNTISKVWDSIPPLPDSLGKIACSANRIGDTIFIMGGYHVLSNTNEISSNRVHRYVISQNAYLSDGASIPVPIDDQVQVVWKDSLIVVITGWSNTENVNDVQVYNPRTDVWSAGTPVNNFTVYKSFGASGCVLGDTIYYFGGAASVGSFGPQNSLRRGVAVNGDLTNISWTSFGTNDSSGALNGYRTASFSTKDGFAHWIGGSPNTYNYNGIAYDGSGGVSPSNQNLVYQASTGRWEAERSYAYPMDLRGIAYMNDSVLYIAGGMEVNQSVSRRCYRLERRAFEFTPQPSALENETENRLTIYPQPIDDVVYIKFSESFDYYSLFTIQGLKIAHGRPESHQIFTENIAPGTYILRLENLERTINKKVIIR